MMTESMLGALKWLIDHNGDGIFNKQGGLMAGGERAPFQRVTWNRLRDLGAVEFYSGRLRVTEQGRIVYQQVGD